MRALALVTGRELRAYAPAWAAALVAALLPWLAPLLPNASRQPAAEVRLATALVLAGLLGLVLALFAGAGLLARDLAEGRMGFFLALPLRAGTVWAARVLAAIILVLGTMAVIALPAAFAAGELSLRPEAVAGSPVLEFVGELFPAAAFVLLPPLFLLLLAHLLATALRSRSAWLLVDLAGLALCGLLVARSLARLVRGGAVVELAIGIGLAAALVLAALLSSGAVGLARGGVLLSRVHRAQAIVVAAGLLAAALATAGYAQWVLAVDAGDLFAVRDMQAAPSGPWVAVRGELRHRPSYTPWLLVDSRNGTSLRLGAAGGGLDHYGPSLPLAFSSDGRRAVWLRPQGAPFGSPNDAIVVELGDAPRAGEGGVEVAEAWGTSLLVEGDRLAIAEEGRLSVWTDGGRRLLAAAELPRKSASWQELRVLPEGGLRLARLAGVGENPQLQIWDLDVAARRLLARVDRPVDTDQAAPRAGLSADGARLLLARGWGGKGGVELVDAATGSTLARLVGASGQSGASAGFLPGGRIAVVVGREGGLTLQLHDRDGMLLRQLPLGDGRWAWLASPWSADLLPYTAYARHGGGLQHELRVVDLASGRVRRLGARLAPVGGASPWWPGDDRVAAGAPATRLFHDGHGALVRVDDAGRQTPVLPRTK